MAGRDPDRALREPRFDPHGRQHKGRLDLPGGAGGSRGHRDPPEIEGNHRGLGAKLEPVDLPGSLVLPPVIVGAGAVVEHSIVGPHVSIGAGAVVRRAIVRDSILYNGARVEDCLLEGSLVGESATVRGAPQRLNLGTSSEARRSGTP